MPKVRPLPEIIAHLRAVIANPQIDTTLIQTQDLALLCDTLDRLRACNADLEAALANMLPLAERYVGRSNGQPNAIYDALAQARATLAKEEKE